MLQLLHVFYQVDFYPPTPPFWGQTVPFGSPVKAQSKAFTLKPTVSALDTQVFVPDTQVFALETLVFNPASLDTIPQFRDFNQRSVNSTPRGGKNAPRGINQEKKSWAR
jgi:hypothetical protein